jgi:2-beta-glucuronyltransferase
MTSAASVAGARDAAPPRVVLISGHYLLSKRRAGFHWLAFAYESLGWDVTFVTGCISWISYARRDPRFQYPVLEERNRLVRIRERMASYVWFTPWHPSDLRSGMLNALSSTLFRRYARFELGEARAPLARADLIIFESFPGLMLFDEVRALNTRARLVYRVSDDLRMMRTHPVVSEAEAHAAPQFDQVSVVSQYLYRKFEGLPRLTFEPHAVAKEYFDRETPNPYEPRTVNVVWSGNWSFDVDFIERASRLFPDWRFHIIGQVGALPARGNVIAYGEIPFADTVPYMQHADIGLCNRPMKASVEALTDTLKVLQYTYCRLPIVTPEFLRTSRTNTFYYRLGDDESIRRAMLDALAFDRSRTDRSSIHTWPELAARLAGGIGVQSPRVAGD